MERYQILQKATRAFEAFDESLTEKKNSVFGVVKRLMRSAFLEKQTDEENKLNMRKALSGVYRVKDSIAGCSSQAVQNVVKQVFDIRNEKEGMEPGKEDLWKLSYEEILLYYSYIERMAKSSNFKRIKALILEEDKIIEESKKKAKQEREWREKERQQKEKEEQQKRLDKMSMSERMEYEIANGEGKDIEYYQKMDDYGEEKVLVAKILKDYWVATGKWDKKKASKKQKEKMAKVEGILQSMEG